MSQVLFKTSASDMLDISTGEGRAYVNAELTGAMNHVFSVMHSRATHGYTDAWIWVSDCPALGNPVVLDEVLDKLHGLGYRTRYNPSDYALQARHIYVSWEPVGRFRKWWDDLWH